MKQSRMQSLEVGTRQTTSLIPGRAISLCPSVWERTRAWAKRTLTTELQRRRCGAILGFYGDHLPSLPGAFAHFGFDEPHSDYVIWAADDTPPRRCDLPAYRLGRIIVDRVLGPDPEEAARMPLPSHAPAFAKKAVRGGAAVGVPD